MGVAAAILFLASLEAGKYLGEVLPLGYERGIHDRNTILEAISKCTREDNVQGWDNVRGIMS